MRVTLVTDTFRPEVNGVSTVLAAMHAGLLARGHAVQVVAPQYGRPASDGGAQVHRVPSIPCPSYAAVRLSWPFGRGVSRFISRFAPDVVHVATEGPLGAFARGYALRSGVPLVTSFHTNFPSYAARYFGPWAVAPTRRYLRWFHGPARATQTPSEVTCAEGTGGRLPLVSPGPAERASPTTTRHWRPPAGAACRPSGGRERSRHTVRHIPAGAPSVG